MSQHSIHLPSPALASFSTLQEDRSFFASQSQCCPEVEIVCIEEGEGSYVSGKDIVSFRAGDVFMTGSNLPHYFRLNEGCAEKDVKVNVVRFMPDFWGDTFIGLNENAYVRVLLDRAREGIMLNDSIRSIVRELVGQLVESTGMSKIILLLDILHKISVSGELKFLSVTPSLPDTDELDRMDNIYKYSRTNFYRKIDLEEIAAVAYVSPNSFCRFFKSRARKTYSRFLIELRVRHACNLLIESRLCAKKICFESGFNNFSNFHKCFKEITGKSPLEYQKEFKSVGLFG